MYFNHVEFKDTTFYCLIYVTEMLASQSEFSGNQLNDFISKS